MVSGQIGDRPGKDRLPDSIGGRNGAMARRGLLNDAERTRLFEAPGDDASLIRLYSLSDADRDFVLSKRGARNQLGMAVQIGQCRSACSDIRVLACASKTGRRRVDSVPRPADWRAMAGFPGLRPPRHDSPRAFRRSGEASLTAAIASGDIWIEGTRNYQQFDRYLLSKADVAENAKTLAVPAECEDYLRLSAGTQPSPRLAPTPFRQRLAS
jgi:hypothetical protein